ncbi:hypothetical protein I3843_02G140800 [Carya illinoinensis]|nr:putative leucine-rich repeat receptor-like serine/threonine-protein kinase At2g24130 [Carya illinoinensis]KAG7992714.1 hypothetical protein I3843_02G140800 [Carya illinoinensis]
MSISKFFIKSLFLLLLQHLTSSSGNRILGHHNPPHHSLILDKAALLAFKKTITLDPNSTLANWDEAVEVCNFTGVRCDKHHHRVSQLVLEDTELVGKLSPFISNLTGLRILTIVGNHFSGNIPPELSSLRHLRSLMLERNNLHGSIPSSFALLSELELLQIFQNNISGKLSPVLFSNCSSLQNIDLSENFLTGTIPEDIGNCSRLWNLYLYNNNFTGQLPLSLANLELSELDVENNCLSGVLPSEIVRNLPELEYLHLSYNNMESHDDNTNLVPFFNALGNCTHLKEVELFGIGLGGKLPSSIGQLGVNLTALSLQENKIFGSIPLELANLSKLVNLNLAFNLLSGIEAEEMGRLSRLEQLLVSHNVFTGAIPSKLSKLAHLGLLDLSHNRFSGEIPASLGNLVRLTSLFLNNNLLSGAIPSTLGNCTNIYKLDLSHNRLTGNIPPVVASMREIRIFINLSHNHLEGPLPIELSMLQNVQEMDLSSNKFTGSIFPQISSCIALMKINFSNNSLEGSLPESLGKLRYLESFDVSQNHLSGTIPKSINNIQSLAFLNLSYNNFEGMIPTGGIFDTVTTLSFLENPRLCRNISGKLIDIPICSRNKLFHSIVFLIIFILVIFISVFLSTICCVIGIRRIRAIIHTRTTETVRQPTPVEPIHNFPRITYKELSDATAGFDGQRLVGSGSYGRVYRGVLPDGTTIAVKVLHVQSGNSTKSFSRECQVLKRIRHRNLIRIITACSLPDFKALVLPYMANGSLDSHLYPQLDTGLVSSSSDLSLPQRLNICSDIAEGMAYLHHHSPVRVIHCDLKPSNILLNDEMTALVSDFGIAKLVMTAGGENSGAVETGNSTVNMLHGSVGYIAPEYGFGSTTTTKGDVYSFGIIVLEMVTRRRPTDDMFVGGLSLHKWVKSHFHERMEGVIDTSLVRASRDQAPEVKKMWEVAIGELIELGILCTQDSPSTRPTMLDAADDLDRLKRYLGGDTTVTFTSSLGISSSTLSDD